jgi:hypothetical protein
MSEAARPEIRGMDSSWLADSIATVPSQAPGNQKAQIFQETLHFMMPERHSSNSGK